MSSTNEPDELTAQQLDALRIEFRESRREFHELQAWHVLEGCGVSSSDQSQIELSDQRAAQVACELRPHAGEVELERIDAEEFTRAYAPLIREAIEKAGEDGEHTQGTHALAYSLGGMQRLLALLAEQAEKQAKRSLATEPVSVSALSLSATHSDPF